MSNTSGNSGTYSTHSSAGNQTSAYEYGYTFTNYDTGASRPRRTTIWADGPLG